jgi:hypothetical protein
MQIIKPQKLSIRESTSINEKFIQDYIAQDPSVLGLGDLVLKDKERMQPRAGRLDLLLMEPETTRRYEVEIQLGKTDESHIIRTIEYWDIERKRYPQYDHCAVIVAEDITSRFLNVVNLFNGFIPLIAIQMNAYSYGNQVGIIFTKVLDEMPLGLLEEDDESGFEQAITNRDYWLKKASPETMEIADEFLVILNETKSGHSLQYKKANIGIALRDQQVPFFFIKPRKKNHIVFVIKMLRDPDLDKLVENSGLDFMEYNTKASRYRIRIGKEDLKSNRETIKQIIQFAQTKDS